MWTENPIFREDLDRLTSYDYIPWDDLRDSTVFITGATGLIGYTAVFALLAVILTLKDFPDFRVFDVLCDGCHVCDEGALRIGCGRGGLPFRD